jgi:hypothetical protein
MIDPERGWNIQQLLGRSGFLQSDSGEGFSVTSGAFTYRVSTLLRLLQLELCAVPLYSLRKCKCPTCQNPYFVAHHRQQQYCSEVCAHWAQRQWRLRWWNKKGRALRKKKRTAGKGITSRSRPPHKRVR